jgi:hypothetical protein
LYSDQRFETRVTVSPGLVCGIMQAHAATSLAADVTDVCSFGLGLRLSKALPPGCIVTAGLFRGTLVLSRFLRASVAHCSPLPGGSGFRIGLWLVDTLTAEELAAALGQP